MKGQKKISVMESLAPEIDFSKTETKLNVMANKSLKKGNLSIIFVIK